MKILTALGISIGVLAGLLIVLCNLMALTGVAALGIAAWPGFVAWACYYAVGGKKEGLAKVVCANSAGAIVAVLIVLLMQAIALIGVSVDYIALPVAVVIGAFVLVVEANWKVLSFIPGAFAGCACAFGFGVGTSIELLIACLLSLWIGALGGIASDKWGNAMVKKES